MKRAVINRVYTRLYPPLWVSNTLVREGGLPCGKPQSVYVCVAANSIRPGFRLTRASIAVPLPQIVFPVLDFNWDSNKVTKL
ncbi:MAG: hypothetical protein V7L23_14950 [Nostoc sp.]|uniref:hypothetical protein n=1 Tax=Nostoc sp. TaxID=1180 RepID=UPI002FEFCCB8